MLVLLLLLLLLLLLIDSGRNLCRPKYQLALPSETMPAPCSKSVVAVFHMSLLLLLSVLLFFFFLLVLFLSLLLITAVD